MQFKEDSRKVLMIHSLARFHRIQKALLCAVIVLLGACAKGPFNDPQDPNEQINRGIHSLNKGVDSVVLRPASKAYGAVVPDPVSQSVRNFGDNLGSPSNAVNNLLQGDLKSSGTEILRFGINSTLGLAGLFDPATELGIKQKKNDFGTTLHRWGADQGTYVELPLLGPSTERDTVGLVVDALLNPASLIQNQQLEAARSTMTTANILRTRDDLGATLDDVLYNSVDSYNQTKILYLARRNAQLNGGQNAQRPDENQVQEGIRQTINANLYDEYEDFYDE